jgi:hypothetical protein
MAPIMSYRIEQLGPTVACSSNFPVDKVFSTTCCPTLSKALKDCSGSDRPCSTTPPFGHIASAKQKQSDPDRSRTNTDQRETTADVLFSVRLLGSLGACGWCACPDPSSVRATLCCQPVPVPEDHLGLRYRWRSPADQNHQDVPGRRCPGVAASAATGNCTSPTRMSRIGMIYCLNIYNDDLWNRAIDRCRWPSIRWAIGFMFRPGGGPADQCRGRRHGEVVGRFISPIDRTTLSTRYPGRSSRRRRRKTAAAITCI